MNNKERATRRDLFRDDLRTVLSATVVFSVIILAIISTSCASDDPPAWVYDPAWEAIEEEIPNFLDSGLCPTEVFVQLQLNDAPVVTVDGHHVRCLGSRAGYQRLLVSVELADEEGKWDELMVMSYLLNPEGVVIRKRPWFAGADWRWFERNPPPVTSAD